MAGLKISDADLVDSVTDETKMPTGEVGDKAISVKQLLRHLSETKSQTIATASIDPNVPITGVLSEFDALSIIPVYVTSDVAARLRLYFTEADRDSDLNRPVGMSRSDAAPVILEYITTASFLGGYLREPFVLPVLNSTLYYTITNLSTIAAPVSFEIGFQGGF